MNERLSAADEELARERIEAAMRDLRVCTACGGSMRMAVRGAELWAECERLGSKRGLWLAVSAGFHDRLRVELPDGALAAA